jgi:hypothetical protein
MPYKLKRPPPPLTDKDQLVNQLMLIANYVELGDPDSLKSAGFALSDLIDRFSDRKSSLPRRNPQRR